MVPMGRGGERGNERGRCRHDLLPVSATLSAIGNVAFHLAPPPLSSSSHLPSYYYTLYFWDKSTQNNPSLLSPHSPLSTSGNTTTFTVYISVVVSALVDGAQLLLLSLRILEFRSMGMDYGGDASITCLLGWHQ